MQVDNGPHPHSRLQREEDELGDGEDEFAEYTGATERIPIGERAEKEWQERQKREMEAAVRGDFDQDAVVEDEMDEDEEEWERAQLRRTVQTSTSSAPRSREASPFRPAPIPDSAPLPAVGTCSTRLELTLRALEQSTAASAAVIESATRELETLDAAERENKLDVVAVEDKASWFNELDEFVVSLARFMEEKVAKVEEVERQALELLVRRNTMLGKRRGRWLDERLEVCFGSAPKMSAVVVADEDEQDSEVDSVFAQRVDVTQLENLDAADELSFRLAQQEMVDRLSEIFADVQAPEYLDPAASATSANISSLPFLSPTTTSSSSLHPRSLVSRFSDWRRLYPEEYAQVWGGLSLAQIWEFYARLELIPWLPFDRNSGSHAMARFRWFAGASEYTSDGGGGDDEVLTSIVANVLVSYLVKVVEQGGYLVWSEGQTREAVEVVEVVQTVLGSEHARCVSLGEVVVETWRRQVERLREVAPKQMGGASGEAAKEVVDQLVGLLRNLLAWERVLAVRTVVGGRGETPTAVMGRSFVGLVENLVLDVIQPLTDRLATESGEAAREEVIDNIPQHILAKSEKLSLLAHQP